MPNKEKGTTRQSRFDTAVKGKRSFEVEFIKLPMILGAVLIVGLLFFRSVDVGSGAKNLSIMLEDLLESFVSESEVSVDSPMEELVEELALYDGPLQVGLTMPEVNAILGDPYGMDVDSGEYRYWFYADDDFAGEYYPTISFDVNNFVDGWYNYEGWFDSAMLEPSFNGQIIERGITAGEVYNILGTPDYLESDSPQYLWYNDMYIELSYLDEVIGWRFLDQSLAEFFQKPTGAIEDLSIGMLDVEVANVLGAPNDIFTLEDVEEVVWLYGNSSISFNMSGQLVGWFDEGELILMRKIPEGDESLLFEGMFMEEVALTIGTPKYIVSEDAYVWGYETMYVEFDDNDTLYTWGYWSE